MGKVSFLVAGLAAALAGATGCWPLAAGRRGAHEARGATAAESPIPRGLLPRGRDDGLSVPANIRGKVLKVDKLLGVVIVNVGQVNGVRPRYGFIVRRGDRLIGRIVVDETYADMSACHYGRTMKAHVEVGDEVTTRLAPDAP